MTIEPLAQLLMTPEEVQAKVDAIVARRTAERDLQRQAKKERDRVACRRYYQRNRGRRLAEFKEWAAANPEKRKELNRRRQPVKRARKYGLTPEAIDAMLLVQEGRCAICPSDKPGGQGDWHVDHCHETGRIRGLLCQKCNQGLGLFRDKPALLRAAATYVESYSDDQTLWQARPVEPQDTRTN